MAVPAEISTDLHQKFESHLYELISHNKDIKAALLATTDGFEVAMVGDLGGAPVTSAAAMTSSMLSLAIAMVNESQLGLCQNLIIEALGGKILIMSVPGVRHQMLLTIVTKPDLAFGQLLFDAKVAVNNLAKLLKSE